jgi:hypothetical protein
VGVEPTLPSGNTILSRGRLPVPPHRHVNYLVLSDHLHTRGNWRDAVEGYSLIIFAETQIYQGLQLIRKTFTHWILSRARLPIPTLWLDLFFNANFIIVIPPRLVKSSF